MVSHILLLKLHNHEATPQKRSWVRDQASLLFDVHPQCTFKWKTPLPHDLHKWDGLILIESAQFTEIRAVLDSTHYHQWLAQIDPVLACIKGWSFEA
jgi:hypothetical protein